MMIWLLACENVCVHILVDLQHGNGASQAGQVQARLLPDAQSLVCASRSVCVCVALFQKQQCSPRAEA